jgi:hypothetical protein
MRRIGTSRKRRMMDRVRSPPRTRRRTEKLPRVRNASFAARVPTSFSSATSSCHLLPRTTIYILNIGLTGRQPADGSQARSDGNQMWSTAMGSLRDAKHGDGIRCPASVYVSQWPTLNITIIPMLIAPYSSILPAFSVLSPNHGDLYCSSHS